MSDDDRNDKNTPGTFHPPYDPARYDHKTLDRTLFGSMVVKDGFDAGGIAPGGEVAGPVTRFHNEPDGRIVMGDPGPRTLLPLSDEAKESYDAAVDAFFEDRAKAFPATAPPLADLMDILFAPMPVPHIYEGHTAVWPTESDVNEGHETGKPLAWVPYAVDLLGVREIYAGKQPGTTSIMSEWSDGPVSVNEDFESFKAKWMAAHAAERARR